MSADSRSAQKWKGMVIGMDKKEAAQKLMSIFGNVDAIAVLHSVLVGISKYIIIIVFAVYTWHCIYWQKHGAQRGNIQTTEKDHVYDTFYLFASIIFEQSVDKNCSFLCGTGRFFGVGGQGVFLCVSEPVQVSDEQYVNVAYNWIFDDRAIEYGFCNAANDFCIGDLRGRSVYTVDDRTVFLF